MDPHQKLVGNYHLQHVWIFPSLMDLYQILVESHLDHTFPQTHEYQHDYKNCFHDDQQKTKTGIINIIIIIITRIILLIGKGTDIVYVFAVVVMLASTMSTTTMISSASRSISS